jgi:succinate dehydrogenase / fumarate reductase flavoprotein subunit
VHGANRLGTNSLLDLVVFGRAAALRAKEVVKPNTPHAFLHPSYSEKIIHDFDKSRQANKSGSLKVGQVRQKLQRLMQAHCAVFRTQELLDQGIEKLSSVVEDYNEISLSDKSLIWNTELVEALELKNLIQQSIVTLDSASNRKESRGGHARDDYPDRDDENWMKHSVTWLDCEKNKTLIGYRPVHMYTLTDEIEVIPPKPRVY